MYDKSDPVEWLGKYLRLTNYLGAAQLYLRSNFLLTEELKPEHIKRRVLGHWGTVPGLNFIWACLNILITRTNQNTLLVVGPGHGYPAIQANLFVEGSFGEFFPLFDLTSTDVNKRKNAFEKIIRDFSWPGGFPSHSNPYTPGCILEGGELGYSLSTSYGAAFDNPDLMVACVVGDGEAETGPMAASWHSNKFLNPKTSGAVLPIVHINGYKISGPTIQATMSNEDLINMYKGFGYDPILVEGNYLFEPMIAALDGAYEKIKSIQKEARENGKTGMPRWPVILLKSPKGWFGPEPIDEEKPIVDSFRSHGIPLEHPQTDEHEFNLLKQWLESYKIHELIDDSYALNDSLLDYMPHGDLRLGMNKESRAVGSKDLKLPNLADYEICIDCAGENVASSMAVFSEYMRDIFKMNEDNQNFRLFSPDETESNKLHAVFGATKRAYLLPTKWHDENLSPDGRVLEILSEHTLQGWFEGYVLTGRHGVLVTYEAFAEIISSMVDQYVKFMRHARNISWRNNVPSINLILTSLNWRQDHNGFSHQNPGFISSVLNNQADFVDVFFPADANSMLVVMEDCFKSKNRINVIVAGKRPIHQWLTLDDARKQLEEDIRIWDDMSDDNPDIVLCGCGDYATRELVAARLVLKKLVPELKIRMVNITQLSCFGIGDNKSKCAVNHVRFDDVFTPDKPIIFNYHGYAEDIKSLIFNHHSAPRFSIHGYVEVGTTTTPFDMLVQNKIDRFNLAIEAIELATLNNPAINAKKGEALDYLHSVLKKHREYVVEHGTDIPEVEDFDYKI